MIDLRLQDNDPGNSKDNPIEYEIDPDKPMKFSDWDSSPFKPSLFGHDVHIWRSNLLTSKSNLDQLASSLPTEEIAAAQKFHLEQDQKRYILSHAILRVLLSRYMTIPPEDIRFIKNKFGKPALEGNATEINFNISHAEDMALFAFTRRQSIGVDIEYMHEIENLQGIATSFMSSKELEAFVQLPERMQLRGFFRAWTRKEALIKAIGKGMSLPLDQVEVGVHPTQSPKLKIDWTRKISTMNWQLIDLDPSPNYVGAVAVDNPEISLGLFTFTEGQQKE